MAPHWLAGDSCDNALAETINGLFKAVEAEANCHAAPETEAMAA